MNPITRFAIAAVALAATTAVFGGQGGGKIKFNEFTIKKTTDRATPSGSHLLYQDIFIPANANCLIVAADPGAGPHVKVFSGIASRPGMGILKSQDGGKTWSTSKSFEVQILEPPTSRSASQNNLKQMSLAAINFADTRISLLTHMADGSVREVRTVRLKGLKASPTTRSAPGRPVPTGSVTFTFTGLEVVAAIGTEGGIWRGIGGG